MVRKYANMGIHILNDQLAGENGTLSCFLLSLICLKFLLMKASIRKQLAYKKCPGECMDTGTQFQNEIGCIASSLDFLEKFEKNFKTSLNFW